MSIGTLLASTTIVVINTPQLLVPKQHVLSSIQTDNEDTVAHALKLFTSPDNGVTFATITRIANNTATGQQVPLDIVLPNLWVSMTATIGSVGLIVNAYGIALA